MMLNNIQQNVSKGKCMSVIYTRRGDAGNIDLGVGQKISKASLFAKVLGYIDELNVVIGWVKAGACEENIKECLHEIQSSLFEIASVVTYEKKPQKHSKRSNIFGNYLLKIKKLEDDIDELNKEYGPVEHFLYPGKNEWSVRWHMARVVCRHAERNLVAFSLQHNVPSVILAYINRLSDWFFIKAYEAEEKTL